MDISTVIKDVPATRGRFDPRVLLAFAAIYVLWGGTFLAIRVAVLEIPPFFSSGVRFFIAGALLYAFMRLRGQPSPSAIEWRSIATIALCMFVATYGALFWAAQYVPSGITAVIEATLPITTVVLEVFVFRQQPFRWRTLGSVALGFGGVAWLLIRNDQPFPGLPCVVILAGGTAWSLGAVLTRSLPRPKSVPLAAGAQMMVGGAVLLALSQATGELQSFPHISMRAALALSYLHCRRFAAWLHRVRLAARPHARDTRREPRLRQSAGGPRPGLLRRRGDNYHANDSGIGAGARQRPADSQDTGRARAPGHHMTGRVLWQY